MYITFRLFKLSLKSNSKYIKEIDNDLYERNTDIYNITDSYNHFFRVYMVVGDDFIQFVKKKEEKTDPDKKFAFIERLNQKILNQNIKADIVSEEQHNSQKNYTLKKKTEKHDDQDKNQSTNKIDIFNKHNEIKDKCNGPDKYNNPMNNQEQSDEVSNDDIDKIYKGERVLLMLPDIFNLFFSMSRISRLITMNEIRMKFYTEQECKLAFDHLNTQFCKMNERNDYIFNVKYNRIREMYKKELKNTDKTWNELKKEISREARKDI